MTPGSDCATLNLGLNVSYFSPMIMGAWVIAVIVW